jgi:beta propeller repeat protein
MYDLSTHKETPITSNNLPYYYWVDSPAIYGNLIAWDAGVYKGIINIYNLSTHQEEQFENMDDASDPAIYGSRIVGTMSSPDYSYIAMPYPSTSQKIITTTSGRAMCPDIYGNKIVWQDNRNGDWDIYMYDLSTQKETQITTNSSDSINPVIYGNNIVWQDNRNGNWQIYAYDLVTHQEIHTPDKSNQINPDIYGNKIVWTDDRNGNPDIYMGTISYLPVAAFSAYPTTGTHPLNVQFTDKSTDAYYNYWNFGDKTTSTLPSPTHKYTKAGKYTVSYTVKNAAGSNSKSMYITVK